MIHQYNYIQKTSLDFRAKIQLFVIMTRSGLIGDFRFIGLNKLDIALLLRSYIGICLEPSYSHLLENVFYLTHHYNL